MRSLIGKRLTKSWSLQVYRAPWAFALDTKDLFSQ